MIHKRKSFKELTTNDTILPEAQEFAINMKIDAAQSNVESKLFFIKDIVNQLEMKLEALEEGKSVSFNSYGEFQAVAVSADVAIIALQTLLEVKGLLKKEVKS